MFKKTALFSRDGFPKDEYTHSGSTLFFHDEFGNLECEVVKFGQAYNWSLY